MSKVHSAGPHRGQQNTAGSYSFQQRFGDRLSVVNKDGSVSRVGHSSGSDSPSTSSPQAGRRRNGPSSADPRTQQTKQPQYGGGPAVNGVPQSGGGYNPSRANGMANGYNGLPQAPQAVPSYSNSGGGYASRGGTGGYGLSAGVTPGGVGATPSGAPGGGAMSLEDHMAQLNVLSDFINNPTALAPGQDKGSKVSVNDLSNMPKVAASQDFVGGMAAALKSPVNGNGYGGPASSGTAKQPQPPAGPANGSQQPTMRQVREQQMQAQVQAQMQQIQQQQQQQLQQQMQQQMQQQAAAFQTPYGNFRERDENYGAPNPGRKEKGAAKQRRRQQSEPPQPTRRREVVQRDVPEDEKLYFSKKPRKVDTFEPYHLGEYRKMKDDMRNFRAGGLGPDLERPDVVERRDKLERMKEYGRNTRYMMGDGELPVAPAAKFSVHPDNNAKKLEQASEKRAKALEYAKNVPKPKVKPRGGQRELPDASMMQSPLDAMELKHQRDLEQVEAIRREFG